MNSHELDPRVARMNAARAKKRLLGLEAEAKVEDEKQLKITFSSGASSSGSVLRFDLIPRVALEKLARRFTIGATKYGDFNYRKGLHDKAFIVDRLNHLQTHVQALLSPQNQEEIDDDNAGAIMWAASFIAEIESHPNSKAVLLQIRAERARNTVIDNENKLQNRE